jgi:hypothetical protein
MSGRLFCDLCGDEISVNFPEHYRLLHPGVEVDREADVLAWADGEPVVIEENDPDFEG